MNNRQSRQFPTTLRDRARIAFLAALLLAFPLCPIASSADSPLFKVPRVDGITVDGSADDWGERGYRVEFLTSPDGGVFPLNDFDVKFRLGWNREGLLVLAVVRDDVPTEQATLPKLWESDCLEFIVAERVGSANRLQLVVASGADPAYKRARTYFFDWRPEDRRATALTARVSSRVVKGGATVEALLPWKNLGLKAEPGLELGFQLVAHDLDSGRIGWYPVFDPGRPGNMHRIILAEKPNDPVLLRVDREIVRGQCTLSVRGSDACVGMPVEIRASGASLVRGQLDSRNGRSDFAYSLPAPRMGEPWPQAEVLVAGRPTAAFESLPTLESILQKYVAALGGPEAIRRIRTRRLTGKLIHDFPGQNPPRTTLPAEVIAAAPDKWRLVLRTSGGVQQLGFDGERGWTQDADRVLIDNRQARSRLAYLLNPQGAVRLEDYFPQLILKESVQHDGRREYAVKAVGFGGGRETLYFDAETGLLSRLGDNIQVQCYHPMMGVLHPAEVVMTREGGASTYVFSDIEVNTAIEDSRFAIPYLGEVFSDVFEGLEESKVLPLLKDFPSTHEEMSVPCRDGRFLHDLILRNGYTRGLEIGTFTGYSALWMGRAFEKNGGRLITIEVDAGPGEKARENILSAGLDRVVDVRIADAFAEIPKIEGDFDFVFIDAWKPDYKRFLDLVRDRVAPGGAIIGHNVTNGAQDMPDYLTAIRNDPGLETTFHELSAEGMSLSIVRSSGTVLSERAAPPPQTSFQDKAPLFSVEDLQQDFNQLRRILENEHCCLYEYVPKEQFDALFDERFQLIDRPMRYEEFFRIIAPLAARIGCMHTALWMPGRFFDLAPGNLFPLQVRLIENNLVVAGSYREPLEVPGGSILLEINGVPADEVVDALRAITSADARNPYFIDAQVEKRFPVFYASVFGFPDKHTVTYALPGRKTRVTAVVRPADIASVRKVIFAHFNHPPLTLEFLGDQQTALMTVKTFIYYDRVDYFREFMDDSFRQIKDKGITNLVLDLRGNDGGDPFCAVILFSYLAKEPAPYFAEPYGKYADLASPIPLPENRFTGNLYTLLDGRCASTNGHFCSLLKYHRIGTIVGTPSGSTYKCNAGKNTEIPLDQTAIILTLGRTTYAAAVKGMDKSTPIMPDYLVRETYKDFLLSKDVYLEAALRLIARGGLHQERTPR